MPRHGEEFDLVASNELCFMKWHESGFITLILDADSEVVSSEPITNDVNWRGYKGEAAWDCDYWNMTEEETAWLQTIEWE